MAIVVTFNDWKSAGVVPQSNTIQAALNSRLQIAVCEITFGASDDYVTAGIAADLTNGGRIKNVIGAFPITYDPALDMQDFKLAYDVADKKILIYEAGTAGAPFDEVGNADSATNSKVLKFFVIGYA